MGETTPTTSGAGPEEERVTDAVVKCLLIVEPEPLLRWSLVTYLGRWFHVFAVDTPAAADRIQQDQRIDSVVISDDLPDGAADDVERHARLRYACARVVRAVTRPAGSRTLPRETWYIEKPFDLSRLANLLGAEGGPPASQSANPGPPPGSG